MKQSFRFGSHAVHRFSGAALGLAVVIGLAACSDKGSGSASQVAAQVNGDEISVHQINHVLQRTPGLTPERVGEARKAILERLIEQQVLVQAASEAKLDRDPEVLQRLEAGRREILARAWLERGAAGIARPNAKQVTEYFEAHPQLFRERKVYKFDEIVLRGRPMNWPEIEKALVDAKTIEEAAQVLRAHNIDPPIASNATRGSEQIPLAVLPHFERLKEGDVIVYAQSPGIVIAQIQSIRSEPVDEKRAAPVIEQFLVNRERSQFAQTELKRLRQSAEVTYVGEFATAAAPPSAAESDAVAPAQASPAAEPAPAPTTANLLPAQTETITAGGGDFGLEQGVKGLR